MWKNGEKARKLPIMLALLATLMFSAMLMLTPIARAVEEEDPFSYTPATYSATVMQGGSTSVTVSLGIKTPPTLPPSAFPVTTTGWNPDYPPPSGWTLTDTIQAPKTSYTWNSISDTVSVMLGLTVPSTASPSVYPFTLYLKPGSRADGGSAVGAGTGIAFSITVQLAKVSIMVTSSPATGSGFIRVDGTAYDTPKTFSWTPGTTHTLEALSPVAGPTDTQYVWASWSDGGAQTHEIVTPSVATTYTANYQTQYYLTMSTNFGTVSPSSGWHNAGEKVDIQAFAPSVIDGEQYVWLGWTGTGDGNYTGADNPAIQKVTMNGPITETAAWRHEYRLTMATNFGTTTPSEGEHWYEAGTPISIQAFAPDLVYPADKERYVWLSWTGSGDGSYTNGDNPASITMNGPITETATWRHDYYLTVNTNPAEVLSLNPAAVSGQGWYEVGTTATVDAVQLVDKVAGQSRYDFRSWTDATPTGEGNKATVLMDSPKTATANYQLQHYLTVISPYDTPGGEDWYDEGDTAYATLEYGLIYIDGGAVGFTGWSVDGAPAGIWLTSNGIIMDGPKTAVAVWEAASDIATYGDVRTVGFWRHQFTVWYRSTLRIKGAGTAQVSVSELESYLTFIWMNSEYFKAKYPSGITKMDAYTLLAPLKAHTMKEAAEQQLFAVWLNLARKAFFLYTELSQDTLYVYCRYTLWGDTGLQTIAEAIKWSEKQLTDNANLEAAKDVCESINQNLGVIWTAP